MVFIKGNYEEFPKDVFDGKQTDSFYDMFREFEVGMKTPVVQACSPKSGEFKALDLAHFIDEKYYD